MQTTSEHPAGRSRLSRAPLGGASPLPPPPSRSSRPGPARLGPAPLPQPGLHLPSRGRRGGRTRRGTRPRDAVGRARGAPRAPAPAPEGGAGSLPRRRPRPRFFSPQAGPPPPPSDRPKPHRAPGTSSRNGAGTEGNGGGSGEGTGGEGRERGGGPTPLGARRFALIPHAGGGATSPKGPLPLVHRLRTSPALILGLTQSMLGPPLKYFKYSKYCTCQLS